MRILGNGTWRGLWLVLLVVGGVLAAHSPSIGYDFTGLDDDLYVVENPLVKDGFSEAAVKGAWTTAPEAYWAPLLWMSFMGDVELSGGMEARGFHRTNVLLFSLNAGLLFWLFRRWTGREGVALAAALLWALHPARVESVAWITERKDVLSGVFFLLGIGAYVEGRRGTLRHGVVLSWLCLVLGGMAKQILIVMPAALMLLDVWPLGRTSWSRIGRDGWRLAAEKWAFWIVAVALACLPIWFHIDRGFLMKVPVGHRLAMIPIHYLFYFGKLAWPTGLMPLQEDLPFRWWAWVAGVGILGGTTWGLWRRRERAPWALMGWLWFVGLLFPLSGLVWAGQERLATRFMYIPQMGLMLAVALAADGFFRERGRRGRWGAALVCGLVLAAYVAQTLRLLPHWRDKTAFGEWVMRCNPGQGAACMLGGGVLMGQGEWVEADAAFCRGVVMQNTGCMVQLSQLRNWCGQTEWVEKIWNAFEAETGRSLLEFEPRLGQKERVILWGARGQILRAKGDFEGALAALKEAVRLEPDPAAIVVAEFLRTCHEAGRPEEGAEAAARLKAAKGTEIRSWGDLLPRYLKLWREGGRGHAYGYFTEYARRHPEDGMALNNMAWLLATAEPDGLEHAGMAEWPAVAVAWAERALEWGGDGLAGVWDTLGAARANAGDYPGAVAAAERGMALAQGAGDWILASQMQGRLEGYRAGRPWREDDERAEKRKAQGRE